MAVACFGGPLAFDMHRPSYDPIVPLAFQEMEAGLASSTRTDVDVLELGAGTGIFVESTLRFLRQEVKASARETEGAPPPAHLCRSKLRFLCTEPHEPYVEHMKAKYAKLLGEYNEEAEESSEALANGLSPPKSPAKSSKSSTTTKSLSKSKSKSPEQENPDTPYECEHAGTSWHTRTESPTDTSGESSGELSGDSSGEGASLSDEEPSPAQQPQTHQRLPRVEARVLAAPAEILPLGDSQAKAVLCASSLHWFCNERAFREMHRVLIDNGVLAAVWVILDPEIAFWAHFKRAYGTPLYSQKGVPSSSSTDFASIVEELSAAGTFPLAAPVRSGELRPSLELTPVSQLLEYLRTTSAYNELADGDARQAMLADMRAQMERDPEYVAATESVPHRFRYRYLFARVRKH